MSATIEQIEFAEIDLEFSGVDDTFARLIREAVRLPASDLYFNWNEDDLAVSVRHLGLLKWWGTVTREEGARLVNYVKACAGMDVAQKLKPLDGRWVYPLEEGGRVDLRISTIPTLYGEDMSIRVLERERGLLNLENLGFHQKSLYELLGLLRKPGGLVLVTGPAGTGKTTTLYACLKYLNDGTRKINTIEDPIEYSLDGIRQSQVNLRMKLDFPELLRSVLRQTPDIIMVGEVRDPVTAQTAVRAANSGHLVFATLHAPIAAAAIDSMLAFGVPPHFLGTSLLGILSQRLVRTLCEHCRITFDVSRSPQTFDGVRKWLEPDEGQAIYGAPGCKHCRQEGYTGRTGVLEVLRVSRTVRRMIFQRRPAREIQDKAIEQGMLDLRSAALLKVAAGVTSTEELVRAIPSEETLPDAEGPATAPPCLQGGEAAFGQPIVGTPSPA